VNPEFGSKADFKELVDAAHKLGMKVILDWVANHAAWDNVWTVSNPDFFERDPEGNFKSPHDWKDVIQINHNNQAEQQAMINAMKYWVIEFDIDGFRADLAHLIPLPFWINARAQVSRIKNDMIWLAETEEIDYHKAFDISLPGDGCMIPKIIARAKSLSRHSWKHSGIIIQGFRIMPCICILPATTMRIAGTVLHLRNTMVM
jgi:glycosidase